MAAPPASAVAALDAALLSSVHRAVAQSKAENLRSTEKQAVDAFADRLDVVGKMRFGKEDKQMGLTPGEAQKLILDLEDAKSAREKMQEQMERAETQARGCVREMQRLQGALDVAAADRETLLQTLLAVRKELARKEVALEREKARVLDFEHARREEELAAEAIAERAREAAASGGAAAGGAQQDEAAVYRKRMQLVQSLLEHERRVVREAREELHRDRALRTEAEVVLRAAIADARRELEAQRQGVLASLAVGKRGAAAAPAAAAPSADALLQPASRAAVLEALLSQEAILSALPPLVFPQGHARTLEGLAAAAKDAPSGK